MAIEDFLREHKDHILKQWFQQVIKTYPEETARFLTTTADPFDNPVGADIKKGIEEVFDQLLAKSSITTAPPFLERLIKIRAVQDFRPSQAVSFVFALKDIVRGRIARQSRQFDYFDDVLAFNKRIDDLALVAFNAYMQSRENVCEIRVHEVKNRVSRLLKRANLLAELEEDQDGEEEPPATE